MCPKLLLYHASTNLARDFAGTRNLSNLTLCTKQKPHNLVRIKRCTQRRKKIGFETLFLTGDSTRTGHVTGVFFFFKRR